MARQFSALALGYAPGATYIPNGAYALSYSSLADGALVTLSGPGNFGTKPNGSLCNYLARYGYGYTGATDPLSRNSWTDAFWPEQGATGPAGGLPGLQTTYTAPGSSYGYQTIFPGAAVITGDLTNGSNQVTNVVQVSGTSYLSVDYAFGGIIIADIATNYIAGGGVATATSQPNLASGQIAMTATYTGTSHTGVTFNIAYGPDQTSCPRPVIATPTQDQLFAFRGQNNYGWRSTDFFRQNNKFIRGFTRTPGLGLDFEVVTDGNGSNQLIGIYNEGTTITQAAAYYLFNGSAQFSYVAGQWFQHLMWYHGNSTATSTDGGLLYVVDGSVLFGAYGSVPNMGIQFYGTANGGGGNPACWDYNDIACRPLLPLAGDQVITDYTYMDDSACAVLIGGELQWPSSWSASQIQFYMHRSYLDALNGGAAGSLNGLSLTVQLSNYSRLNPVTFTARA